MIEKGTQGLYRGGIGALRPQATNPRSGHGRSGETWVFMKVLLLNPPGDRPYLRDYYCSSISKTGYYWHPIDLLVLSASLSAQGLGVSVLDAIADAKDETVSRRIVEAYDPDAVIFLTGATSWPSDARFMRTVAARKPLRVVGCGEVFLGDFSRLLREEPWLEAGIVDFTDPGIPAYVFGGGSPPPGVVTRSSRGASGSRGPGRGKFTDRQPPEFAYGIPRYDLFPMRRYHYPWHRYHPFASVLTTYGCPSKCAFCNSGSLGFKVRRIDDIEKELSFVGAMGLRQIFIKDMSFAADRAHAVEFCTLLRVLRFTFSWNCYARVDNVDEHLLSMMKRAGCHLIQFGLESGDEALSRRMGKSLSEAMIARTFLRCRALGIRTGAHFVMGLPTETETSIQKDIDLACRLNPDYVSFNIFMPRYGSPLMKRLERSRSVRLEPHARLDPSETLPEQGWADIPPDILFAARNRAYRAFYLRPAYLFAQIARLRTAYEVRSLLCNGLGLLRNLVRMRVASSAAGARRAGNDR